MLSFATQHAKFPEFGRKLRMECLSARFPLPTLHYTAQLPAGHEERAVGGAEGGHGDGERHEPGDGPQQAVAERHRHRLAVRHLARRHRRQVRHVHQRVAQRHQRDADHDAQRQVPAAAGG